VVVNSHRGIATFDLNPGEKIQTELNSIQGSGMAATIGSREKLIRAAEKELIRNRGHLEI
jgi:hypothetical protein